MILSTVMVVVVWELFVVHAEPALALKHLQRWIWKGLLVAAVAAALLGGAGLVRLLLQG